MRPSFARLTRRAALVLLAAVGLLSAVFVSVGCVLSAPGYEGPRTANFDGKRFANEEPRPHGFGDFLRWVTNRERGEWPKAPLAVAPAARSA